MPDEHTGLRVGIGSLGAIGLDLAGRLVRGVDGLELTAASATTIARASERLKALGTTAPAVPLSELAEHADVVVECAPAAVFREVAEPALRAGKHLVPLGVGALLTHWDLVELAASTGARISVPSGAILGLDGLRAAAEGGIESVTMVTRKPPAGLAGAPHLIDNGIDLGDLDRPLRVFAGSAREGARVFPANVNVAAAVALSGLGPDRTTLEVWADPTVTRNTHMVEVESDSARFSIKMESIPTRANPRTGRIVAQSVVATLRRLVEPLTVGT
ncbi:MAG: aspartate dehydrogenase [Gammaproteobacteria bacterium]